MLTADCTVSDSSVVLKVPVKSFLVCRVENCVLGITHTLFSSLDRCFVFFSAICVSFGCLCSVV